MASDTFLAMDEIQGLTNKINRPSQIKVLNSMGIEHRVRPDGTVAILRAHITKIFDGESASNRKQAKTTGPNWDAI